MVGLKWNVLNAALNGKEVMEDGIWMEMDVQADGTTGLAALRLLAGVAREKPNGATACCELPHADGATAAVPFLSANAATLSADATLGSPADGQGARDRNAGGAGESPRRSALANKEEA